MGCPSSSISPVILFTNPKKVIGTSVTRVSPSIVHEFCDSNPFPLISMLPFW